MSGKGSKKESGGDRKKSKSSSSAKPSGKSSSAAPTSSGKKKTGTGESLNASTKNPDQMTIHEAAGAGAVSRLRQLLDQKSVNVNEVSEGLTPLHWATASSQKHCMLLLIQKGADVNARTPSGNTPLHLATWGNDGTGDAEAVVVLLQAGAANIHEPNKNGITPLDFARMLGDKGKEVRQLFTKLEKQIEQKKKSKEGNDDDDRKSKTRSGSRSPTRSRSRSASRSPSRSRSRSLSRSRSRSASRSGSVRESGSERSAERSGSGGSRRSGSGSVRSRASGSNASRSASRSRSVASEERS